MIRSGCFHIIILCKVCEGMGYTVNINGKKECQNCKGTGRKVVVSFSIEAEFKIDDALRSDIKLGNVSNLKMNSF